VRQGFFLRELGSEGQHRVLLQVLPAPGADLADRLRDLDHPGSAAGPATVIPLTGPVFGGEDLGPVSREFLSGASPLLGEVLARGERDRSAVLSIVLDLLTAHIQAVAAPRSSEQSTLPEGLPL